MTIPARANWCPACEDTCDDHERVCTVCGTELQDPRAAANDVLSRNTTGESRSPSISLVPDHLRQELLEGSRQFFGSLRQSFSNMNNGLQEQWQTMPADIIDPQSTVPRSRPTSKAYLEAIPNRKLQEKSQIFHSGVLQLVPSNGVASSPFEAIPAEFGGGPPQSASTPLLVQSANLVVAEPRTGKGGLSAETLAALSSFQFSVGDDDDEEEASGKAAILYMDRGDITFARKAWLAQKAGAAALVVGNQFETPWPYVMSDSKGESLPSEANGNQSLTIPVVMIKQSDAQALVAAVAGDSTLSCDLKLQRQSKDCAVCCDEFAVGSVVMRLPACNHVFHSSCALTWLQRNNTCPFCRRELPTDDPEYERERRRTQRTHAGSEGVAPNYNQFYG